MDNERGDEADDHSTTNVHDQRPPRHTSMLRDELLHGVSGKDPKHPGDSEREPTTHGDVPTSFHRSHQPWSAVRGGTPSPVQALNHTRLLRRVP